MREFEVKRRVRQAVYSRWSIGFLVFLLVFFARATWNVYTKKEESAQKRDEAARELKSLKVRQAALVHQVESLKTTEGIEHEIRDRYRMAKDGEELVVIVDAEQATTSEIEVKPWYKRFLPWLK